MCLSEAREHAADLRAKKRKGVDVATERKLEVLNRKASQGQTFRAVAEDLLELKRQNGVTDVYRKKIEKAFDANVYSNLGNLPLNAITPALLRSEFNRIAKRGSLDMLGFVLRVTGEVFDLAKADGRFQGENPTAALSRNVFPKHRSGNMKALPWSEIGDFQLQLVGYSGNFATACCIRLLILTATRPGEIRLAKWAEFDLKEAQWIVPAERMKMRKEHKVPLSSQAIKTLGELKKITGASEYLFPAQRGAKAKTISDMAVLKAIRKVAGHERVDAHGFRAVFRTHAAESLQWPEAVLEAALAHGKKNAVVGSYDRSTFFPERKKLMQWYADELDAQRLIAAKKKA